jgi:hypothetical protein
VEVAGRAGRPSLVWVVLRLVAGRSAVVAEGLAAPSAVVAEGLAAPSAVEADGLARGGDRRGW